MRNIAAAFEALVGAATTLLALYVLLAAVLWAAFVLPICCRTRQNGAKQDTTFSFTNPSKSLQGNT